MPTLTYRERRGELETYFDRTASDAWKRLTSNAPVSRIRATVRAGRDEMRATLASWLPDDLSGMRVLDAGCGTGTFSIELARRGAEVIAVDISTTLVEHAADVYRDELQTLPGSIAFHAGDMLDPEFGEFDYVVAMDSVIHYARGDVIETLTAMAERTTRSMVFTFAPKTPLLAAMHSAGQFFPRSDRAPAIVPHAERKLFGDIDQAHGLAGLNRNRTHRVKSGFYTSQGLELVRAGSGDLG